MGTSPPLCRFTAPTGGGGRDFGQENHKEAPHIPKDRAEHAAWCLASPGVA